tara:strand:+ start:7590 stop:7832 length:243 start_codon:yes stop_codon:yes gene_type:complete
MQDNNGIEQTGTIISEYFGLFGQVAQVKVQSGGNYYIDYRDSSHRILKRVVHPDMSVSQVENIAEDWSLAQGRSAQLLNE